MGQRAPCLLPNSRLISMCHLSWLVSVLQLRFWKSNQDFTLEWQALYPLNCLPSPPLVLKLSLKIWRDMEGLCPHILAFQSYSKLLPYLSICTLSWPTFFFFFYNSLRLTGCRNENLPRMLFMGLGVVSHARYKYTFQDRSMKNIPKLNYSCFWILTPQTH